MGSGSFPLDPKRDGKELKEIVDKLEKFYNDWWDSVYSGDSGGQQFDNSASDGASLEGIRIAKNLLKECLSSTRHDCGFCGKYNLETNICSYYNLETNSNMRCYEWKLRKE